MKNNGLGLFRTLFDWVQAVVTLCALCLALCVKAQAVCEDTYGYDPTCYQRVMSGAGPERSLSECPLCTNSIPSVGGTLVIDPGPGSGVWRELNEPNGPPTNETCGVQLVGTNIVWTKQIGTNTFYGIIGNDLGDTNSQNRADRMGRANVIQAYRAENDMYKWAIGVGTNDSASAVQQWLEKNTNLLAVSGIESNAARIGGLSGQLNSSDWKIPIPGFHNLNTASLVDITQVNEVAAWFRGLMVWAIAVFLFQKNYEAFDAWYRTAFLAPQATTSGTSVMGTNINASSAVLMAGLIAVLLATLPALIVGKMNDFVILLNGTTPLQQGGAGVTEIVWKGLCFLDKFCPLASAVTALVSHLVFRSTVQITTSAVMVGIRFLVGA